MDHSELTPDRVVTIAAWAVTLPVIDDELHEFGFCVMSERDVEAVSDDAPRVDFVIMPSAHGLMGVIKRRRRAARVALMMFLASVGMSVWSAAFGFTFLQGAFTAMMASFGALTAMRYRGLRVREALLPGVRKSAEQMGAR